jgi:hypothetical protein
LEAGLQIAASSRNPSQAHAASDYHTIVVRRTQLTLHRRSVGFVWEDETNLGLPSAVGELLQHNRDAGANPLCGDSWRQRRVRIIHSLGIEA